MSSTYTDQQRIELNHQHQRSTQRTGTDPSVTTTRQSQRQPDEHHRRRPDDQVQHEREPLLDQEEHVKRPLALVQHLGQPGPEGPLDPVRSDAGHPSDGVSEVRVQRGLGLDLEQPHLSRGAQVVSLHEPDGEDEDRRGEGEEFAEDGEGD